MSLITGQAFLLGTEVNTDIHCSSKYLPGKDSSHVSTIAFEQLSPNFAQRLQTSHGGIIVAGENFGINSSREQAIAVLHLMQVRCILAPSFGRQFFRNAINNGLAILECDTSSILADANLQVDLVTGQVSVHGILDAKDVQAQTQSQGQSQSKSQSQIIHGRTLPKEILKIIAKGGLIPFLNDHPDWNFSA